MENNSSITSFGGGDSGLLNEVLQSIDSLKNFVVMQMELHDSEKIEAPKGYAPINSGSATINSGAQALRVIVSREKQISCLPEGLREEAVLRMLLDLFYHSEAQKPVSVTSLCLAAGRAPTTALRFIEKMDQAQLIRRRPCPIDRRVSIVVLTDHGKRIAQNMIEFA